MAKLSKVAIYLLLFVFFVNTVSAPDTVEGPQTPISPGDSLPTIPGSGGEGPGTPIDANTNWETVDLSGMTSDQIYIYFDSIPDWRFDELNQQKLAKALKKKYNIQELDINVGDENNNAEFEQDSFYFSNLDYLNVQQTIINNGVNVKYKQGNLTAEHADSVIKDGSITTNVEDLNAGSQTFFLGKADSLMSDSITLRDLKNATVKVKQQDIQISFDGDYEINITDKSFAHTSFNATEGSSLVITKTIPAYYNLSNGSLSFSGIEGPYGAFTETVQTATNASVYLNPSLGFICAFLMPLSTYAFYSFEDTRRDFAISIPQNSSQFKVCTRKDWVEKHDNNCNQCAIIDFVSKKIEMHGFVSYLRHHIKGSSVVSSSLQLFHISLPNASASFTLDAGFIFIPQLRISYTQQHPEISRTFASRYHTLYERQVNNSMHRFLKTNFQLPLSEMSDNLVYTYTTNYSDFDTTIRDNVVSQKAGSKVTVLPPNHPLIKKYLP
ncbi:hypothetical protein HYV81_02810 [Candidatus Woesearchaeota archaeon]|nr:hypothetical protein [Candidatus Woesearchaeota archaeon]